MLERAILDFKVQAEQMLRIMEGRLQQGEREAAVQMLILKFKSLYEQGVINGKLSIQQGINPYQPADY